MLFLRLLCAVENEPFSRFEQLNQQSNENAYNKMLYEVVKFGERCNFEKELDILIPQLAFNPDNRPSPEKLCTEIQIALK